jgi:hypothetical protein
MWATSTMCARCFNRFVAPTARPILSPVARLVNDRQLAKLGATAD